MIEFEGFVDEIIYENKDNGYVISTIITDKDYLTVVGYIFGVKKGEYIKIFGEWVNHPEYGEQIKVNKFERVKPKTKDGLKEYLTSGIFSGIGKTTANRIINKFGDDTFDILQNEPQKLSLVKGISVKKALEIKDVIDSQKELNEVISSLKEFEIDQSSAFKLYRKYGKDTIKTVKNNPYILVNEDYRISFKKADNIALKAGVSNVSEYRVKTGIIYILNNCADKGNSYVLLNDVINYSINLLEVDKDTIENLLVNLNVKNEVYIEKTEKEERVYLYNLYYDELYSGKKLFELQDIEYDINSEDIKQSIEKYEKEVDIKLSDMQKEAVEEAILNGVMVITGGPGTGKTTIIRFIIGILENEGFRITLAAPTGRAAKKLSESSDKEAKTIHRLLEANINEKDKKRFFIKGESDPIDTDVIIIDEMSMVDIQLVSSLLKAIEIGTKLILVGDIDQLPSVGPGNVLKDIINSNFIKVIKLNKVFRQAQESMITVNAHRINEGSMPKVNLKEKDFFFIGCDNANKITDIVADLCQRRLPNTYNYDPFKDIQVLTPMRKGETGVINLNVKLQERLNPKDDQKMSIKIWDTYFRVNDRVMQIKNNYNLKWAKKDNLNEKGKGVFNGDTGIIEEIDKKSKKIIVLFDDMRYVVYDYTNFEEIEKSYAITIHKSQGSEYPVIIIPLHSGPNILMTRNLLYTAVTRAKEMVVIVGKKRVMENMIKNEMEIKRNSGLCEKLIFIFDNNT